MKRTHVPILALSVVAGCAPIASRPSVNLRVAMDALEKDGSTLPSHRLKEVFLTAPDESERPDRPTGSIIFPPGTLSLKITNNKGDANPSLQIDVILAGGSVSPLQNFMNPGSDDREGIAIALSDRTARVPRDSLGIAFAPNSTLLEAPFRLEWNEKIFVCIRTFNHSGWVRAALESLQGTKDNNLLSKNYTVQLLMKSGMSQINAQKSLSEALSQLLTKSDEALFRSRFELTLDAIQPNVTSVEAARVIALMKLDSFVEPIYILKNKGGTLYASRFPLQNGGVRDTWNYALFYFNSLGKEIWEGQLHLPKSEPVDDVLMRSDCLNN